MKRIGVEKLHGEMFTIARNFKPAVAYLLMQYIYRLNLRPYSAYKMSGLIGCQISSLVYIYKWSILVSSVMLLWFLIFCNFCYPISFSCIARLTISSEIQEWTGLRKNILYPISNIPHWFFYFFSQHIFDILSEMCLNCCVFQLDSRDSLLTKIFD